MNDRSVFIDTSYLLGGDSLKDTKTIAWDNIINGLGNIKFKKIIINTSLPVEFKDRIYDWLITQQFIPNISIVNIVHIGDNPKADDVMKLDVTHCLLQSETVAMSVGQLSDIKHSTLNKIKPGRNIIWEQN